MNTKQAIAIQLQGHLTSRQAWEFQEWGNATVSFGEHVHVYIINEFSGGWSVGVNWSALGTVNARITHDMVRQLEKAAYLTTAIQEIINKE